MTLPNPAAIVDAIESASIDGGSCFSQTLDLLEHGLDNIAARADAWSVGDLATLRGLPGGDTFEVCAEAARRSGVVEQIGFADFKDRQAAYWTQVVDQAMARNAQTFALLPLEEVTSPTGMLSRLRARGYAITEPDENESVPVN
ncbi:TraB/GumN family protein [Dyella sp. LX-66]|uniref:TraB/GumN family protein n=1 Tax=unclassified Dyella TaxID=2634549 RepID=UPI001BDF758C|nr:MULTISPECIES: TraB/GumN family protein [unclassified Dyella]MBT2119376.1 TraB/GumN family protein [Dyella sp. LX-1]MBT2138595.1 TraB/GumN family protein [Dyella sp. LX-66]